MEFFNQIGAFILQHQQAIFWFSRFASSIAIASACLVATLIILVLPIRIRFGIIRIDGLLKLIVSVLILGWMAAAIWAVVALPFVIIAKLCFLHLMIIGSITCLVLVVSGPQIDQMLDSIQQDCQLANNLTFLQAEMARAQLQGLSDRIKQSMQPEEKEITETVLKSISPLVSLFLKRERSVLKWSFAAVDVGRTMMRYFWSDKK
jgi:hypothetical protein